MIELFRLVFPYLLVLYFIIKGIKEPLYFLGIPFLMFMSESIFFEGAKLFRIPGSLSYALMFIWLIILWIVSIFFYTNKQEKDIYFSKKSNILDLCIAGLIIISVLGLCTTIINYSNFTNVFQEFITLISLFVAYFIIKNWSSNNKPEQLIKFLYSLVIINSISSLFYILHQGLHFYIYQSGDSGYDIAQGAEITRDFYFMPQFLPFSIAYLLVFKAKKPSIYYLLLAINLLAVIISYTRSSVINAGFLFILYFVLIGLKKGRIGLIIKNILIYCFIGFMGLLILSRLLPTNTKYLLSRFTELSDKAVTGDPNNLEYRFTMTGIIISNIDPGKRILGMGSATETQISWVRDMRATTADMVWTGVIFRWGFVGLVLFILLYLFSLFKAFFIFMKSTGDLADLTLMFFLYIFSQVIESFVSWTFMSGHGFTTGLWYFAMLSALIGFKNNNELSKNIAIQESE